MKTMLRLSAVAALLAGSSLAAQESVGTVLGTIKTDKGAALEGARIQLSSPALLGGRTITTESNGSFRMPLLPPGSYTMIVSKTGYVGSSATFRVNAGLTLRQDLTLRPIAEATAVVEVVATTASVDKTDTKTATTLSADKMDALPVSKTAQSALFLSPGVSGTSDAPSIRGGVGGATQFTINGISVRDNVMRYGRQTSYVIGDLTEEIQVIQNPLNARFGNASGGMVNVVTKSGTNEFQGSFRIHTSRNSWENFGLPVVDRRYVPASGSSKFLTGSALDTDSLSRRYQFTLQGPVIKDVLTFTYGRTWAPASTGTFTMTNLANSLGYNVTSVDARSGVHSEAGYTWGAMPNDIRSYTGTINRDRTDQVKLFWMINQDQQLEAYYTLGKLGPNVDDEFKNLDPDTNHFQETKRTLGGLNYRALLGGGVLDVKYGRTRKQITFPSGPGDPIYIRSWVKNSVSILDHALGTAASNQYLTNADPAYSLDPELRQNDTVQLNYLWTNGVHQIDVGGEQFKETSRVYPNAGNNQREFRTLGRVDADRYVVYNYFASTLPGFMSNPELVPAVQAIQAQGSGLVPSYTSFASSGGDVTTRDTTRSFYLNDIWTITDHWQVMAGLRYDNWRVENRRGTEVNTHGFSPRFEVKFDINGNQTQVLNASVAQFRGVIGQGNLIDYARKAGNILNRYFWNEGAGDIHYATKAQILDTANYKLFRVEDTDSGRYVSPNLKPEQTTQMELGYRRNFENGGSFRATFVATRTKDLWYRRGVNQVVDPNGLPTIMNVLDIDPINTRNYRGVELEWNLPIYRTAVSRVDFNGFWTSARNKGRVTFADGTSTETAIRFDDIYQAAGYALDRYNASGEYSNSVHNNLKGWLSWTYGAPKGIVSVLSVMGQYSSGGTFSTAFNQSLPGFGDGKNQLLVATKDTPTYVSYFMGHRGQWTQPDTYSVDLKWNLTIPVANRLNFFTELSVFNIFNSLMVTTQTLGSDTAVRGRNGNPYDPTYRVGTELNWSGFGLTAADKYMGGRSFAFDFGFRF